MKPGSPEEKQHFEELGALWSAAWPASVPREPHYYFGECTLFEHLRGWARVQPDKPAIIHYGNVYTFAQYDELTDKMAALLSSLGVRKGDRVATFLTNCPQYHFVFYGIMKLGAVYVPVSPLSKSFELTHQLTDSGARVIIAQDQLMPLVREARDAGLVDTVIVTSLADTLPADPAIPLHPSIPTGRIHCPDAIDLMPALQAASRVFPDNQVGLDDLAALNYTGGTTGLPKGCMHTHRNMFFCALATAALTPADAPPDVMLNFLPQFWIAGENTTLIRPVMVGQTMVTLMRWDALAVMKAIEKFKATTTVMPVDCAVEFINHPELANHDLSSLRTMRVIGLIRKLTPELRHQFQKALGVTLHESSWGMTETHTSNTFVNGMQDDDFDLKTRQTFVGLPVINTQFKIADFETGETLPIGAEGELCCMTPSNTKGYWGHPDATAQLLRDGWLHTGDRGTIEKTGHILYLGRRKEMIKVKGMSVFPAEVEAVLALHPAVGNIAVVPRPDEARGQVPVAFVIARHAVDADELVRWCAERMAAYKVPEVRIVESMPMTATGKVRKVVLEEMVKAA